MKDVIKKYKIEFILSCLLLICIVIFIILKCINNEPKLENYDNLLIYDKYDNSEDSEFYSNIKKISLLDYNKKQVVSIGEKVQIASSYISTFDKTGEDGTNNPSFIISVDKAMLADSFCGMNIEGRKYLVIYMTVRSLYDKEAVLTGLPELEYYNKVAEEVEARYLHVSGKAIDSNCMNVYNEDVGRNLARYEEEYFNYGSCRYRFEEFYCYDSYVYVPANGISRIKIVYTIDSDDERLFNSEYEMKLSCEYHGLTHHNTDYGIRIPYDSIQLIENVNDGWNDENEVRKGNLYDHKKVLSTTNFFDFQVKSIGDTVGCYVEGTQLNITLKKAIMSGNDNLKKLRISVMVENVGDSIVNMNELEGFDIAYYRPTMYYYNPYNLLVENWKESANFAEISPGESKEFEFVIPIDCSKISDNYREYVLGFQLWSKPDRAHSSVEFTNEDFAFILDWDKVEIIND